MIDFKGMRYAAGLSLNDVAKRTGYSRSHVANVEAGTTGASRAYEEVFQRAVSNDNNQLLANLDTVTTQQVINKTYRDLERLILKASHHTQSLTTAMEAARNSQKTYDSILEIMQVIVKLGVHNQAPGNFDIMEAGPEQQKNASNDIVSIWISALKKYNIHNQDQATRDQILESLIEIFKEEFDALPTPAASVLP